MTYLVIGGDVGGTNSRLALYTLEEEEAVLIDGKLAPGTVKFTNWYQNSSFSSFTDIMRKFLEEAKVKGSQVNAACLAIAGPVSANEVTMTNRGKWVINGDKLARDLGIKAVELVNDFVALGYGLLTTDRSKNSKDVKVLQEGKHVPGAPIACIGAGTGLGECFLTQGKGGHYVAYPTEGGHAEFPPRTEVEFELLQYLKNKYQAKHRVSVERIISGPGIANVYEFLAKKFPDRVDPEVHKKFEADVEHGGKVVAMNAKPGTLANDAMEIFTAAYGSEAGVAGLKFMPFGGLFIAGGLTPKNLERIQNDSSLFMQAFHDKGRVSPFLKKIPLYAVLVEDLGERGAHWGAVKLLLHTVNRASSTVGGYDDGKKPFCCTHATVIGLSIALAATTTALLVKSLKK